MREPILRFVVPSLWVAWLIYWWVSARDVKPTQWREPLRSQALHRVPLIVAAILLGAPGWLPHGLRARFVPAGPIFPALGATVLAAGLGFSVWARRHLGRNWSADVVIKEDHALIRTGPYRHVRHPIYTGILFAFLGTAIAIGEWRSLIAVGVAVLSFVRKSWVEEQRMQDTFPEYAQYQRESAALIPFIY
jgi:protein-S-isoprenylcysteine O-methyltransferase Ste14